MFWIFKELSKVRLSRSRSSPDDEKVVRTAILLLSTPFILLFLILGTYSFIKLKKYKYLLEVLGPFKFPLFILFIIVIYMSFTIIQDKLNRMKEEKEKREKEEKEKIQEKL